MEFFPGGIMPLVFELFRSAGEEGLSCPFVAQFALHPGLQQVADKARDARIVFGGPHACPARHFFVQRDGDVFHDLPVIGFFAFCLCRILDANIVLHEFRVNDIAQSGVG